MKIYMLWDMEGVSGLFRRDQVWHWEANSTPEAYARGRDLLIADINSAVRAALDAGATEIIAADTHSGGGNIELDRMWSDPRVSYRATATAPGDGMRQWMPDVESCDGLMLLGHHARAGTTGAFLPHTWTGSWTDVRLNGLSVGELGLESCFAGHWSVPFMLAQGDDFTQREVEATYPGVIAACVKTAQGNDRCDGPEAAVGRQTTAACIATAVERGPDAFSPFRPDLPLTVSIDYVDADEADVASRRPGVTRIAEQTIEACIEQHCDVLKWILDVGR